jgi:hypothetical protein
MHIDSGDRPDRQSAKETTACHTPKAAGGEGSTEIARYLSASQTAEQHGQATTVPLSMDQCPWAAIDEVLADEVGLVRRLRAAEGDGPGGSLDPGPDALRSQQPDDGFVGLALSGGGIRSATFSLGVIQALAQQGWLRKIDYLSTVSGGGYIGAWLSTCILRARLERQESIRDVEQRIAPRGIYRDEEPPEIRFLRAYSNYLTPRLGLFSGDTLAALAGFSCNLGLNLFIGVVSIAVVVAFFHWLVALASFDVQFRYHGVYLVAPLAAGGFLISLASIAFYLVLQGHDVRKSPIPKGFVLLQNRPRLFALAPLAVSLVAGSAWAASTPAFFGLSGAAMATLLAIGALAFGAWYAVAYLELDRMARDDKLNNLVKKITNEPFAILGLVAKAGPKRVLVAHWIMTRIIFAALACGALLYGLAALAASISSHSGSDLNRVFYTIAFGPTAAAVALWLFFVLWMGIAGNTYSEFTREWLNRFVGELVGLAGGWLCAGAVIVFARPTLEWAAARLSLTPVSDVAWLLVGAVLFASIILVAWRRIAINWPVAAQGEPYQSALAGVCYWLAVLVVLASLATLYQDALVGLFPVAGLPAKSSNSYSTIVDRDILQLSSAMSPGAASLLLAMLTLVAWVGFAIIDVNAFSIQNLFRNRVVRCYLGAAHPHRLENPYAGFDPGDDYELRLLGQQRPYLLMNAALNIARGQDLARQRRKAASFVFSPRWCGFWLKSSEMSGIISGHAVQGGFVRTDQYVHEAAGFGKVSQGVMVGTAMATSGAVVSSQMGFASRGPLAFLLTLMNLRLGRWLPNPARKESNALWKKHSPDLGAFWYLRELFGATNERYDWVYVSDGGHFENLGLYELIRRRCSRIICVDGGADRWHTFTDLGGVVQKCRVDFGVEIKLDTAPLRLANDGSCESGYAIGSIEYPAGREHKACSGIFVYIKPSVPKLDHLPADILSYRAQHPEFPHEHTHNQWFSERQFESYRHLGFLIGMSALEAAHEASRA